MRCVVNCHALKQACSSQGHPLSLQQPHILHCIGQTAMGRTTSIPPASALLHNMVGFTCTVASKLQVTHCRVMAYASCQTNFTLEHI